MNTQDTDRRMIQVAEEDRPVRRPCRAPLCPEPLEGLSAEMSDEQRPIPEFLRPHLTQEQYDRAREYLKTPHTRVDLTMEEWDSVKNGQGWPKDCWTLPDLSPEGAELTQDYLDYIHERLAAQEPDPWEGLALEVRHDHPRPGWTSVLGPDGEPRTIIRTDKLNELLATKSPGDQETKNEETK